MEKNLNYKFVSVGYYIIALILLAVIGFNESLIANRFILSLISLTIGCAYSGYYFFATLKRDVESNSRIAIFLKGLVFYLALLTAFARYATYIYSFF